MLDWKTVVLRMALAALAGGVIGWNREKVNQAAGFRTYMIVTAAAALTSMIGIWISQNAWDADLARLPAAYISGLGFFGAGAIWTDADNSIRGVTTAAGLLATSVTGISLGFGFYTGGAINFVMLLCFIALLDRRPKKFNRSSEFGRLYCELTGRSELKEVLSCIESCGGDISELKVDYYYGVENGPVAASMLVRETGNAKLEEILAAVKEKENVTFALFI